MAESFVQLPDDSTNTGKLEDHFVISNGNYREAVVIGDPVTNTAVASVTAANGLSVDPKTLPPGASTSAAQATGNTTLGSINTNAGAVADAAVTGDNDGTISAKLRGLSKMFADVWDSGNHWLKVSIQNATLAVTPLTVSTATLSNVSASATSVQLLASTAGRKGATFFSDSTSDVYVKFGTTASATSFTYKLSPAQTLELPQPIFTGRIDAIWDSATGAIRITEMT